MTDLPASRDLDALVSRTVMGGDVYPDGGGYYDFMERIGVRPAGTLPHYSTDIRAAMEVAEKLGGWRMHVDPVRDGSGRNHYSIYFYREYNAQVDALNVGRKPSDLVKTPDRAPWHYADTAPLAICRAALAAVGA